MVVARASAWGAHDVEFEAKRVFAFRIAPVAPQRTFVYRKGIPLQEGYPPIFEYGVFEGECDSPNQRGRLSIPGNTDVGIKSAIRQFSDDDVADPETRIFRSGVRFPTLGRSITLTRRTRSLPMLPPAKAISCPNNWHDNIILPLNKRDVSR